MPQTVDIDRKEIWVWVRGICHARVCEVQALTQLTFFLLHRNLKSMFRVAYRCIRSLQPRMYAACKLLVPVGLRWVSIA